MKREQTSAQRGTLVLGIIGGAILLIAGIASQWLLHPRESSDGPIENLKGHLAVIASAPHAAGTPHHASVRDYLIKEIRSMGWSVEIQTDVAFVNDKEPQGPYRGSRVNNLIVQIPGSSSERTVLISAHYDSSPHSPGAADNGYAVASVLEVLRSLKDQSPLRNSLIFLLSDCEELGLLGAKAFIDGHDSAKSVDLALNFDARGNAGPTIMFEASRPTRGLIRAFSQSKDHCLATSLAQEIYKLMPHYTDFFNYQENGIQGLNFANFFGVTHYDTPLDSTNAVDVETLVGVYSNMEKLTHHFGDLDGDVSGNEGIVYFNGFGSQFFFYSFRWVLPLAIGALVLAIIAFFRRSPRSMCRSVLVLLGSIPVLLVTLVGLTLLSHFVAMGLIRLRPSWWWIHGSHSYNTEFYLAGLQILILGISLVVFHWISRKTGLVMYAFSLVILSLLIGVAVAIVFPGASYLFLIPILPLIGAAVCISNDDPEKIRRNRGLFAALLSIPLVLIFGTTITLIHIATGMGLFAVGGLFLVLFSGLLVPTLEMLFSRLAWRLGLVTIGIGAVALTIATVQSEFDQNRPQPNCLSYFLDSEQQTAYWASRDRQPDEWTTQYLGESPEKTTLEQFFPASKRSFLVAQANLIELPAPIIEVLHERIEAGGRHISLQVRSQRRAPTLAFYIEDEVTLLKAMLGDLQIGSGPQQVTRETPWVVHFAGNPEEGMTLDLHLDTAEPVHFRVVDESYSLEALPSHRSRPETYMVRSNREHGNSVFVSTSIRN